MPGAEGAVDRSPAGTAPVGTCAAGRPGVGGIAPAAVPVGGRPEEVVGRKPGLVTVPRAGGGTGVRIGGREANAGPGRGMGVSIGICAPGPDAIGGSSLKGSGVARGGVAGGVCRRSRGISRLRISGGARVGSVPGSQAVQSPCGGNSAPHLRHLDTAA